MTAMTPGGPGEASRNGDRAMTTKTLTSDVIEFSHWDPEVMCPRCGGLDLRHGRVTVFDREEDAEMTLVTTVDRGLSATRLLPLSEVTNPSRHGLTIAFTCERCGDGIELRIAPYKGRTEFGWSFTSDAEDALAELRAAEIGAT
jgi:hypothetical protein